MLFGTPRCGIVASDILGSTGGSIRAESSCRLQSLRVGLRVASPWPSVGSEAAALSMVQELRTKCCSEMLC